MSANADNGGDAVSDTRAATIDTNPHPAFQVYSAGNFAEVAPERLSPMAWSLVGEPVERANRALARRMHLPARLYTGSHYVFVGYFACRPYHNLSAYCHLARQLPRIDPAIVAESYFEGAEVPQPHPGLNVRGLARLRVGARAMRELGSLRPRLVELEGQVNQVEHDARRALASGLALQVGSTLQVARSTLDAAWDLHYSNTLSLVPLRALQWAVGQRTVPYWEELEPLVTRVDGLVWESLRAAAELGRPLSSGEFLDHAFYEVADDHPPWREYNVRPVRKRVAASRESAAGLERDPWSMLPSAKAAVLAPLCRIVADTMASREMSKALSMRCLHVLRQLLPVVANLSGIDDGDWPYLTMTELAEPAQQRDLAGRAERRAESCMLALGQSVPDILDFACLGLAETATTRSAPVARGVSPGRVTGRVVTPETVTPRYDGPQVLVCESADADLEPLLPLVDGLITARGSLLSHVSILVREHGLPAVVGCALVPSLAPGDRITLDGTSGEVQLVPVVTRSEHR